MDGLTGLNPRFDDWDSEVQAYLTHEIVRSPKNLRLHVQRINLYRRGKNTSGVYGALLDLFIVLGNRGDDLRKRMLNVSKSILAEEHIAVLSNKIAEGLDFKTAVPASPYSILSKGVSGTSDLVEKMSLNSGAERDPIEEAHEHIEYGQLEEASEVLGRSVLLTPSREEIHKELLEIYRRTEATEAYWKTKGALDDMDNPQRALWESYRSYFEESA
ncbi:MAG: hypothetical protein MI754_02630 [Chromatiales bacterium]|nr:hypothetical protein [Chromatiales bacterium]